MADRNFARALSLVLKSEGGWSDIAADPGGATMKGVTLATYRRYINPQGTKADLRNITDAQLADVYKRQYWDAIAGDQLPDGVDYAVFDFAVNSGPSRAARYLQQIVGVATDGVIGPATITAASKQPARDIINRLCDARLAFLERLPTWPTFGKGWSARVAAVRAASLQMAAQPATAPQARPPASVVPTPAPVQPPAPPAAPVPAPPMAGKPMAGLAAFLALAAMAVAGWWHEITSWLSSIF